MKIHIAKPRDNDLRLARQICLVVIVSTFLATIPDLAYAQVFAQAGDGPWAFVFCNVANWLVGNTGKGLATIAICIVGIGALMGKVSWGMAIIVGIGIAIIFGAGVVVDSMVTANSGSHCQNPTTGNNLW